MAEAKFNLVGIERKDYKTKEGEPRIGYNLYIIEKCDFGYKFLLKFDSNRRSNNPYFVSEQKFNELRLNTISKVPTAINEIYFDRFGNLGSIDFSN